MTEFADPIWGLVAVFAFMLIGMSIYGGVLIYMNHQKLKALQMMKDLTERVAELEMSQNTTEQDKGE